MFEPPFLLKEIGSVLYLHASLVLNFLVSLLKKILNTKILLASMKTLANSETCTESRIASEFFSGLRVMVGFLHVITNHWTGQIYMSWAVYGTIFRITAGHRSKFHSNRWVSECHNKLFEEGYWKDY
jgi:hypothetical protein